MAKVTAEVLSLDRRFETLQRQRNVFEHHWQDCADYMLPRKADITKNRTEGDKRTELIYDSTAIHSVDLLAASLQGMLTSPSVPWFMLQYRNDEINENDEAAEWLEACTKKMYKAFQRSNFQSEIHELYYDLVVFGTAGIFIEPEDDGIRFSARHIAELYISENMQGRVDTIYRKFKMTARAMNQRFGLTNLPDPVKKALEEDVFHEFTVIHVLYPREEGRGKLNKNKPIASVYYDKDTKTVLSESGFDEMPIAVCRFNKDSVSSYGRSPGMSCLSDVKMLNKMSEVTIRAAQKQIDPPLMVPDDGFMLPVRSTPGSLNFYRSGTRDRLEPLQINANNPLGLAMEDQRRSAIRQAFYVDQLLLNEGPSMTATEVLQRNEERMRMLGPVLGRLQSELLQPLISRCFSLMLRSNALPVPPESLQGTDIDIEYVSPLAKAQKLTDLQSIMRGLEVLMQTAEFAPVTDYIDRDGLVKYLVNATGMPASVINSAEQVAQLRRQQAQAQQQAAQQQLAAQTAENAGAVAPFIKAVDGAQTPQ